MKVTIAPASLIGRPDVNAMLQAFYSRSDKDIEERLNELGLDTPDFNDTNIDKIEKVRDSLRQYYIGYGHQSIGDCGFLSVYISKCSILTAKALQDHPLYNGQETSTRYVDFTNQEVPEYAGPYHTSWTSIYKKAYDQLLEVYKNRGMENKQAKLKAFDVARGFLPVTASTNVAITMNLRQLSFQLWSISKHHPVEFVKLEAKQILETLLDSEYADYFEEPKHLKTTWFLPSDSSIVSIWSKAIYVPSIKPTYSDIPRRTYWDSEYNELKLFEDYQELNSSELFSFNLDYGSYRDLQRHRSMNIMSTIPTIYNGVYEWYLDQLREAKLDELANEILELVSLITLDECSVNENHGVEHSCLASKVRVALSTKVNPFIYVLKLRSQPTVHPTLRNIIQNMAIMAHKYYPGYNFINYINNDVQDYDKRAKQDFVKIK